MMGLSPEDRAKEVLKELIKIIPLKPDKIRRMDLEEKSSFSEYAVCVNLNKGIEMGIFERTPDSTYRKVYYWRLVKNPKIELSLKDVRKKLREIKSMTSNLYSIRDEIKEIKPEKLEKRDKEALTKVEKTKIGDRWYNVLVDCFKMLYKIYADAFDLPIKNKNGETLNISIREDKINVTYWQYPIVRDTSTWIPELSDFVKIHDLLENNKDDKGT